MVYASTRIKRSAAAAFDAETIETDDFIIKKPEGFLTVLNGDRDYAFESYSKEFGGEGAENFRRGTAHLRVLPDTDLDGAAADLIDEGDEVISDIYEVIGERRYRLIEIVRIVSGVEFRVFAKLGSTQNKVFVFQATAISETTEEFMRNIESMVASFELK